MALPERLKFGIFMPPFHSLGEDPTLAIEQARNGAGRYQRDYFENTLGLFKTEGPTDSIIDQMVDRGAWCVGTPDDLIARYVRPHFQRSLVSLQHSARWSDKKDAIMDLRTQAIDKAKRASFEPGKGA